MKIFDRGFAKALLLLILLNVSVVILAPLIRVADTRMEAQVVAPATDASGYEAITVATTAIGFTTSLLSGVAVPSAKVASVTIEGAEIRYRYDGTDPTASEGHLAGAGDAITIVGTNNVRRFRAIRVTTNSAILRVTYLR